MEQEAEIIQFPVRHVHRVNDVKLDLGAMTLLELQVLEVQCNERFVQAHAEMQLVRGVLEERFPDGRVS